VTSLEQIVEVLKTLPPAELEEAADFVNRLQQSTGEARRAALARTAGKLSPSEAEEMERVIEEACERVDDRGW
jgi:hypothetical protein